jgi:drug/metabolite transporter (DMT)-like permease
MTRYRKLGLLCGLLGLGCLLAFEFTDSYEGPDGHLHEAFALQAMGMLLLLASALSQAAHGLRRMLRWIRDRLA